MIRPSQMRVLGKGFQDGIPCTWLEDWYGRRWVAFDLEQLHRMREQERRVTPQSKVRDFHRHYHRFGGGK